MNKALAWLLSGDNQLGNHREEVPEPGMDAASFISWPNYLTVTIPQGAGNTPAPVFPAA